MTSARITHKTGSAMSEDWSRPHWQPSGRAASLLYFVPGEPPERLRPSAARHHIDRGGAWQEVLQISDHQRGEAPGLFASFFDPAGVGHDIEARFGARATVLRAAERGTILQAAFPDPATLDYLRDTAGMVSAVLEHGGLGVLDVPGARWWTPEEWVATFVDRSAFDVRDHTIIVFTDDRRHHPGLWSHTRGMKKFGRPDLQVKHLPGRYGDAPVTVAGEIINDFAGRLARGKLIPDGWRMQYSQDRQAFAFVETPDDSASDKPHFNNSVLEIVDYDPATGARGPGLSRLLAEIVAKDDWH
jgi:hypothetical protein